VVLFIADVASHGPQYQYGLFALYNLKRGISDSIVFKYDETKMDKTGEFVQEKNVYANPLKGQEHLCAFTALGLLLIHLF
jgi:hypothetical protein